MVYAEDKYACFEKKCMNNNFNYSEKQTISLRDFPQTIKNNLSIIMII